MEYFAHPDGRRIYACEYRLAGGCALYLWFTSGGHDQNGLAVKEDGRPFVTAKPGDWFTHGGQRWQVEGVAVWRWTAVGS